MGHPVLGAHVSESKILASKVKLKIDSPVSSFRYGKGHGKLTHPSIQNEMMEIFSSHCQTIEY